MRKVGITIIAAFLIAIGCKDEKTQEARVNNNDVEVEGEGTIDTDEIQYADASMRKGEYAINTEGVEVDYETRDRVNSWNELNTLHATILDMEIAPETEIPTYAERLEAEAENLENTIPDYMLTEEIKESITDIKKEIADLRVILSEDIIDKPKVRGQVEELFDVLSG